MNTDLNDVLAAAYEAKVLHRGNAAEVQARFNKLAANPEFLAAAKAEHGRAKKVDNRRCFISGITAAFLQEAILAFELSLRQPVIPALIPVAIAPPPAPKEDDMSSKLKGLADLAKTVTSAVDKRAEDTMERLTKAHERAKGGLDKVDDVAAEIDKAAADIEDFANQVTNGPPA